MSPTISLETSLQFLTLTYAASVTFILLFSKLCLEMLQTVEADE